MERQKFGFDYQAAFCKQNNLNLDSGYTGIFDGATKERLPIQIKTYKEKGELMMADPFRYLNHNDDFILVIANRDKNEKILSEKIYLIDYLTFSKLLKENNFKQRAEYCKECLNSVSNDKADDEKFKSLMTKERVSRKNSLINMQAKRDHKKQKRVQWAIPNRYIDKFFSHFEMLDKEELNLII